LFKHLESRGKSSIYRHGKRAGTGFRKLTLGAGEVRPTPEEQKEAINNLAHPRYERTVMICTSAEPILGK
jgi:hypothetical protein